MNTDGHRLNRIKMQIINFIKALLKRIESLVAVVALLLIWVGVNGYDKRLALITIGIILLADRWLDKLFKYYNRKNR